MTQNREMHQLLNTTQETLSEAIGERDELLRQEESLSSALSSSTIEIRMLEEQVQDVTERLRVSTCRVEELEEEVHEFEEEMADFELTRELLNEATRLCEGYKADIESTHTRCVISEQGRERLEMEVTSAYTRIESLQSSVEVSTKDVIELEQLVVASEKSKAEAEAAVNKLLQTVGEHQHNESSLTDQLKSSIESLSAKNAVISELRDEVKQKDDDAKESLKVTERLEIDLESCIQHLASTEVKLSDTTFELTRSLLLIDHLTSELESTSTKLSSTQETNKILSNKVEDLKSLLVAREAGVIEAENKV
jgi:chromosome segregation ATPase